jgi:hypothetical protein
LSSPYNFPEPLYAIKDWTDDPVNQGTKIRHMYLWNKSQISNLLP